MMSKFDLFTVGLIRRWLHLRAERKDMLLATDYLSHLPDDILDDIGLSRLGIVCAERTRRSSPP